MDSCPGEGVGVGGDVVPAIDVQLVARAEDDGRQRSCSKSKVDRCAGDRVACLAHGRNRGIDTGVVLIVADIEVSGEVAVAAVDTCAYGRRPVAREDALTLQRG